MSSILASLDMSLDDLIAKKKKTPNPDSRAASRGSGAAKGRTNQQDSGSSGPVRGRQQRKRGGGGGRNQPYGRSVSDQQLCVERTTCSIEDAHSSRILCVRACRFMLYGGLVGEN